MQKSTLHIYDEYTKYKLIFDPNEYIEFHLRKLIPDHLIDYDPNAELYWIYKNWRTKIKLQIWGRHYFDSCYLYIKIDETTAIYDFLTLEKIQII